MSAISTTGELSSRQFGAMTVALKSDREVEFTRVFDAPRSLVFEAMSKSEHLKHWWGMRGAIVQECVMAFHPGGAWLCVLRETDGSVNSFRGEYREIVAPERIVQTFEFDGVPGAVTVDRLTLVEHDGKTTVTSIKEFPSVEARDGMLQFGMERGAAETYDRLEEYLRTIA